MSDANVTNAIDYQRVLRSLIASGFVEEVAEGGGAVRLVDEILLGVNNNNSAGATANHRSEEAEPATVDPRLVDALNRLSVAGLLTTDEGTTGGTVRLAVAAHPSSNRFTAGANHAAALLRLEAAGLVARSPTVDGSGNTTTSVRLEDACFPFGRE